LDPCRPSFSRSISILIAVPFPEARAYIYDIASAVTPRKRVNSASSSLMRFGRCCPLSRAALPTRNGRFQVSFRDDADHMVGSVVPLFHPSRDIATTRDFPLMNACFMTQSLELMPNPKSPVAVAARIAD
jgi:hypothetical protein